MFVQLRYTLGLLLLMFVTAVYADVAVPNLSHRVTDLTATLSAEQSTALENKLAAFEARKGSQLAVLILPTTQPETIEAFGIRVADTWKIGRQKIDDGVILLVAKDDHKMRIEVGRGLEGAIPDAIAKRVIAEIITPKFKANDFAGGIDAGVSQLIKLIEGEPLPAPSPENSASTSSDSDSLDWVFGVLLFVFMFLDMTLAEKLGTVAGTFGTAIVAGLVGTIYPLFSNPDILAALIIGVGMFFVGLVASCAFKLYSAFSGGSSGWSSSGSSGGSWSGGGGSFGGGGASGSW